MSHVSLAVGVGLVCALLSALGTNLAFLFKHRGALAAPAVAMRHPLRSAIDLFRSRWWSIGWGVAVVAFALHVAALTLAPISIGQALLAGGLVFLAVLAERFFGFELGRRQWIGIGLVAVSLALLTLTGGGGGGGAHSGYSLAGMIVFESIAVGVGLLLVCSHLIERIPAQPGVLLGIAAGLGFGISDVAIKALSGDLEGGPIGLLSPWSVIVVTAAVFSFYASARSLQIGDGVAVIAVTSVAANLSTIVAGLAVFGDRLGNDPLVVGVRLAAFTLILVGAALIPAPVRAGAALADAGRESASAFGRAASAVKAHRGSVTIRTPRAGNTRQGSRRAERLRRQPTGFSCVRVMFSAARSVLGVHASVWCVDRCDRCACADRGPWPTETSPAENRSEAKTQRTHHAQGRSMAACTSASSRVPRSGRVVGSGSGRG